MSNSNLIDYTKISPNSNPRNQAIKKLTIHHMAGDFTVETCGNGFAKPERQASANYGIGSDGRVGMYVEEKRRAWTSSNRENDYQAITIEVANDGVAPQWHVSDKALSKLIELCVDVCKRNGIKALNYTGDKSGNLTRHNMFAATDCPGPYLQSKFPWIAEEVNKRISAPDPVSGIKAGDKVLLKADAGTYTNGVKIPKSVKGRTYTVQQVKPDRVLLKEIVSWVWIGDVELVTSAQAAKPAGIRVGSQVKIAGTKYTNGVKIPGSVKKGTYTVQQLKSGRALLKENYSWVALKDLDTI